MKVVPTFTVVSLALITFTMISEWGGHVMAMKGNGLRKRGGQHDDPSMTARSSKRESTSCQSESCSGSVGATCNQNDWNLASVIQLDGGHCKGVLIESKGEVVAVVPVEYYMEDIYGTDFVSATTVVGKERIRLNPIANFDIISANNVVVALPLLKDATAESISFAKFSKKPAPTTEGIAAISSGDSIKCGYFRVVDDHFCRDAVYTNKFGGGFCAQTDLKGIDAGCGTPFFTKDESGNQVVAGMRLNEHDKFKGGYFAFATAEIRS